MKKHTSGEWVIEGDDEAACGVPFIPISNDTGNGGRFIAEVCSTLNDDDTFSISDEDRANANLIAAAPNMYAALCRAEHHLSIYRTLIGYEPSISDTLKDVKAAIVMARGVK